MAAAEPLAPGGITLLADAALEGRNTLRVPARASLLADVRDAASIGELLATPALRDQPLLVLGEGSNILFAHDWPGLVLTVAARGIEILDEGDNAARVRVAAGENWNDFVRWALGHGFAGLENLVLIPGTVGAAPIQNIGAYGVEVCEFVHAVETFDRQQGRIIELANDECAFAYRDSLFKRERDRYIVTAVEFELPRRREPRVAYAGIAEELTAIGAAGPTPLAVAEAVARLRTRKLPDPALIPNAGSFFKNPLLAEELAATLARDHPGLPCWPAGDERRKLSAAWLIEQCGFKGYRDGDAGISGRHALVLVNHGHASGADLLRVARHVAAGVHDRFGVKLEAEPRIV
ncbi:MAG: UDP-N-acetylmuramate dehydrogenase [Xanthomonadales bacterium]|nr:UDP-N-acetylmuramate dehydrogenase [Xanthomonadales bacterium]